MSEQERRLAALEAKMADLQRWIDPRWASMSFNEVRDFEAKELDPLRKKIAAARGALTRVQRNSGSP